MKLRCAYSNILIIIAVISLTLCVGCEQNRGSDQPRRSAQTHSPVVSTAILSYDDVHIEYPVISSTAFDDIINADIVASLPSTEEGFFDEKPTATIAYSTAYLSEELISFRFHEMREYAFSPHPFNATYGRTYNTATGEIAELSDFIAVDEAFAAKLRTGYRIVGIGAYRVSEASDDFYEAFESVVLGDYGRGAVDDTELAKKIKQAGFYMSEQGVVFIFEVPYAVGSSIEVCVGS